MDPFVSLTALAAPLPHPNMDTDVIIRVERCVRTPKAELGRYAFEALRFLPDGAENPDFILNREPWYHARILVCGKNFGCGSSREMAVWAIAGIGIRCVIAPSFGEIFHGNCLQNGLLAIRLPQDAVSELMQRARDPATATFTVDLEQQTVNRDITFDIDPLAKKMLLEGLDAIGLTRAREAEIAEFQSADRARRPWIYNLPRRFP